MVVTVVGVLVVAALVLRILEVLAPIVGTSIVGWIAGAISDLAAAITALASNPVGWIIVGMLIAALVILITAGVPYVLEAAVNLIIKNELSERARADLDKNGLIAYAGEAVAEDIANKVARKKGFSFNTGDGRHRFSENIFQMIHVGEDKCRVFFRKPDARVARKSRIRRVIPEGQAIVIKYFFFCLLRSFYSFGEKGSPVLIHL